MTFYLSEQVDRDAEVGCWIDYQLVARQKAVIDSENALCFYQDPLNDPPPAGRTFNPSFMLFTRLLISRGSRIPQETTGSLFFWFTPSTIYRVLLFRRVVAPNAATRLFFYTQFTLPRPA